MYREGPGIAWGRMRWSWPNKSSSWSLDSIPRTRIESITFDPRDNHSQKCPVSKPSVCWENTASSPIVEGQEAEWRRGPSCVSTVRGSAMGCRLSPPSTHLLFHLWRTIDLTIFPEAYTSAGSHPNTVASSLKSPVNWQQLPSQELWLQHIKGIF